MAVDKYLKINSTQSNCDGENSDPDEEVVIRTSFHTCTVCEKAYSNDPIFDVVSESTRLQRHSAVTVKFKCLPQ